MATADAKLQWSPELTVRGPNDTVRTVPIAGERLSLGRAQSNDLHYPDDPGLSRQHLAFERRGEGWCVRDLGSRNGTFINGARIIGERTLHNGDVITAGELSITFEERQPVSFVATEDTPGYTTTHMTTLMSALDEGGRFAARDQRAIEALIRAGQELSGHQTLAELFELILDLSMKAVGADRGTLLTIEDGQFVPRATRGGTFAISAAIRDRVVNERASLLVMDTRADAALRARESIIAQSISTVMAVPLQTNNQLIGLIYLDARSLLHAFNKDDLSLLTVMANIAAIRIEQARLIEVEQAERIHARELDQAAEIQRQLLPAAPPDVAGLELAGRNIPCRTVGGDYFDYFRYDDGRVAILVGDVAGKGMPAALLMSSLQARLQVLAESALEPGELVTRLNRGLVPKCPGNRFVTFFYALLDPATGELSYCNAGHNPPLIVGRSGAIEKLDAGGPVIGLLGGLRFESSRAALAPGDIFILFSDGVSEASPPGSEDEFGDDRLARLVQERGANALDDTIEQIISALRNFTRGAPFADDVTLVLARRS